MSAGLDLNGIAALLPLWNRSDTAKWTPESAWLAGGSWLFSEPQPRTKTLLDLSSLAWPSITVDAAGVVIAATCTFGQLFAYSNWPSEFVALNLVEPCCRALLGSFKIWNVATVGGNICLALPAGPMISFATALDGVALIWMPDGGDRCMLIKDLVIGSTKTALQPGEILRSIELPAASLRRRATHRRISLTAGGRSAAFLIGTCDATSFALTVTASTRRPVRIDFAAGPSSVELRKAIDATLPLNAYHDDIHGRPAWRQHMTRVLAEEIRKELLDS